MQELSSPEHRRLAFMFLAFSLSGSFISVFLPAYYVIVGSGSLNWALQFLVVQFVLLSTLPSVLLRFFQARFESLLLASFPCYVTYYAMMLVRADPLVTGTVAGVALSLFWPAFQTATIRIAKTGRVATTFTIYWILISSVASMVGPVAGGLVISYGGGFVVALSICAALYAIALIPMLRFRYEPVTFTRRPRELRGPPRLIYLLTAVFVWGTTDTSWIAYPLFALSIAGTFVNLGIITSAIAVVISVAGVWIGRVSDRSGNRFGLWTAGALLAALALLALGSVKTIPEFLVVSVGVGIAAAATGPILVGWFAESYTKESAAPFWARFELFLNPGRVFNLALAAVLLPAGNYAGYFAITGALGLFTIPLLYSFKRKGSE